MDYIKRKYENIKKFLENQDNQQSINVMTSFISDAFKVFMATLLCVFIPQQCEKTIENKSLFMEIFPQLIAPPELNLNGSTIISHTCTINENFNDLIDYNTFVLAFNFLTLGYFIYLYYVEISREKWMITHLDYDKDKTDDNILSLKIEYPDVMDELLAHNKKYMLAYKYLHIIYIMNFLFSAILVIHYYYLDFRTITTLLTNFILCSNKIRLGRKISMESYERNHAYSFYNVNNIGFNVIDRRFLPIENIDIDVDNDNTDSINNEINIDNSTTDITSSYVIVDTQLNASTYTNAREVANNNSHHRQLADRDSRQRNHQPRRESVGRHINSVKRYITTL